MPWPGAKKLLGLVDPLVDVFKCVTASSGNEHGMGRSTPNMLGPCEPQFSRAERGRRAAESIAIGTLLDAWLLGYIGAADCKEGKWVLEKMIEYARSYAQSSDKGYCSSRPRHSRPAEEVLDVPDKGYCSDELGELERKVEGLLRDEDFCKDFDWWIFVTVLERVLGVAKRLATIRETSHRHGRPARRPSPRHRALPGV